MPLLHCSAVHNALQQTDRLAIALHRFAKQLEARANADEGTCLDL